MLDVAGAEVAISRGEAGQLRGAVGHSVSQRVKEFGQGGAPAQSDVEGFAPQVGMFCRRGQDVGLHHVCHITKVAGGAAVAIDEDRLLFAQQGNPKGDHRRVGSVGILTGAEDIEITQPYAFQAMAFLKRRGVHFVHVLARRIRGKRRANAVFPFGQHGVITVHGAAGGIHHTFQAVLAGADEQVQETSHVAS